MKTSRVALASLLFTLFFFAGYIPPFRQVHVPFDLEGFHYPLADYAFQSLKQGRIPQWDPTIYAGMNFTGNIQAALFYPPTWVMYAASLASDHLSYQALQDLLFAHVWIAFLLFYCWLKDKRAATGEPLHPLACVLGAGVFAYSGYVCTQLQHFGLIATYTWFPLALWGIDQAAERQSWKPLWKLALASALAFLAGYPPTWVVFLVGVVSYGLCMAIWPRGNARLKWNVRGRLPAGICLALAASMTLAAVQLLPTWEATRLVETDIRYGFGVDILYLAQTWLIPNLYNFSRNVPAETNFGKDYFYLGAPVVLGLLSVLRYRLFSWKRFRGVIPTLGMGAACLLMATNPFGMVWTIVQKSVLLSSLCRDWYFLAGVTVAFAGLAAFGLDDFLRHGQTPVSQWFAKAWSRSSVELGLVAVAVLWAGMNLLRNVLGTFPAGWMSAWDAAAALIVFGLALDNARTAFGRRPSQRRVGQTTIATVLVLLVAGVDYKSFGVNKRFNTGTGAGPRNFVSIPNDLGPELYRTMRAHPDSRVLLEEFSILSETLRSVGLTTPLGFDPLLTRQLRRLVESNGHFLTDRTFALDPDNDSVMRLFGVRYVVARPGSPWANSLATNPKYQILPSPLPHLYGVFEYRDFRPVWNWEPANGAATGAIEMQTWRPEERSFTVRSAQGGRLTLAEQYYPGWSVEVRDGNKQGNPIVTTPERWQEAFQAVTVPPGEHRVTFRFESTWLKLGSTVSFAALLGLLLWIRVDRNSHTIQG